MPMHQKREVKAKVLTSKKNMAALSQQEKILFALDLSSYDWLNFPHWEKVRKVENLGGKFVLRHSDFYP